MTFLFPIAGWLFLLLPLVWWAARGHRRRASPALRAAILACLIVAVMQPSLIRKTGAGAQIYLLDQRAMLGDAVRAEARAAFARVLATAPRGTRRTLVQLGGEPVPAAVDARETLPGGSLSLALARGLDAVPLDSGASITVIADPRSTDTHWDETVDALKRRGIVVNGIALTAAPRPAFVADVAVAATRVGESARATVKIENDGRVHRLALSSEGRTLATATVPEETGLTRVPMTFPVERSGFMPVRVTLDEGRPFDTVVAVQDAMPLLYLGAPATGGAATLQRLLGRGVAVEAQAPGAVGTSVAPARYPLVFVDDLPAARWPAGAQRAVARAVAEHGTGLIAAGGAAMYGTGSYAATPIGPALPVTERPEEKLQRPSVALAIVIDSSGSMLGKPLEIAKQIARQTARKLTPADHVGVVEFFGTTQWAYPMQPARDIGEVERAIGRLTPQGTNNLYKGLEEAYFALRDVDARYKHILVLSDGAVPDDRFRQLFRRIVADGINTSTVMIGGGSEGEDGMVLWARLGQGRFYSVTDEFNMVAIDFRQDEIKPEPGYRNGRFALAAGGDSGWWGKEGLSAMPPLAGYARLRARDAAQTLLTAGAGDPVLASWQYGSGRVTTFATEALGAGTETWRGWRDYGRWLARVVAMTARRRPDLEARATRRFDRVTVSVQRPVDAVGPAPLVSIVDARGGSRAISGLEERAPGLFATTFDLAAATPALIEARDGGSVARAALRPFSDTSNTDAIPTDRTLPLAALARATGGWSRADPGAVPGAAIRTRGVAAIDLWPWLALLALLLYLVDIVLRRRPGPLSRSMPSR